MKSRSHWQPLFIRACWQGGRGGEQVSDSFRALDDVVDACEETSPVVIVTLMTWQERNV